MRKIILAGIVLIIWSFAPGGSIKSDLIQINKKMYEAKAYRTSVRIVFNYNGIEKTATARSIKMGNLFNYSYMGYTFLVNKKMQLAIDPENKTIVVQDNDMDVEGPKPDFSAYEHVLDSMLSKNYTYTPVKTQGQFQTIKTNFSPDDTYTSLELTYDAKNFSFKSFEYICGKKLQQTGLQRIKVVYDEFNFNPKLEEKDFSESKYIVMKGKKITGPSEKYKGYTVIDQRLDP